MSDPAAPKIIIKHRHSDVVLYEYQPTEKHQASGLAMRAALETATKDGANLDGANLYGANLDEANLDGANLYGGNLDEANLYGVNLRGANLRGANLYGANLDGANLYGANLDGANLYGVNLRGANLDGANLRWANLYGANLDEANLYGANLDGANLRGANLRGKKLIGDRPAVTLGPIGSRCDYFTAYLTDKGIYLRAGCFFGTVAEFIDKLEREHGTNEHGREYRAALALIECHARLWTPDASASQAEATADAVEA